MNDLTFQIVQALGFLKEVCGIHYRDIKPKNILKFIDPTNNKPIWKLFDFWPCEILNMKKSTQ